jgi:CubicO group peptidase (beta-lactamase class C family)
MPILARTRLLAPIVLALLLAIALALTALGSSVLTAPRAVVSFTDIDYFIQHFIEEEGIPGLAVVIAHEEQIVYEKGFGVTSLNNPSPVSPRTVFDLASVSKSFTALGVLLLRDEGLIDLDSSLSLYLPDFHLDDRQLSDRITVRHLLNQTSGLPAVSTEPLAFYEGEDAMEMMVAGLGDIKLHQDPGRTFEYANLNYALLGALIEEVTGLTFEDYMQQRVFTPLGLNNTTVYPEEAASRERADGHQLLFGQVITKNTPVYRSAAPAGWIMSSAEDMGQWLLLHLNSGRLDGEQVVPNREIQQSHEAGIMFDLSGQIVGYGMGWFSVITGDNLAVVWHGGDTLNFGADMLLFPEEKLGVSVLINSQNSSVMHRLASGVAGIMLGIDIRLPTAPWWASWQIIDRIATGAIGIATLLVMALVAYIWREWRYFREHHRVTRGGRDIAAGSLILRSVPLGLLSLAAAAVFLMVENLFGFNPYLAILIFGDSAPPGVWIAGLAIIGIISLWVIALAALAPFSAQRLRYSTP